MKQIKKLGFALLMALTVVSCMDLDINNNPDTPSSQTGSVSTRLPGVSFWMGQTYQTSGFFGALINQQITLSNRGDRYGSLAEWTAANNTAALYPYQAFFVGVGGTLADIYAMAEKEGAYHYMAISKLYRAMGFMVLADDLGEMSYLGALGSDLNPDYDDGKTIFYGCLDELEQAIELFKKTQEPGATPLSAGDNWNQGDVNKWIKLCYGLKARWLNNLTKKAEYNADEVLAALANAPQSNAESTVINHEDSDPNNTDNLWGDPVKQSYVWIWLCNWSRTYYVTKWYADILTNFDGKGIVDPRADKLIPSAQVGSDKHWLRSTGVDMQSDIRIGTNWTTPGPGVYSTATGTWSGDSAFISLRVSSTASPYTTVVADGTNINSGTFYVRPEAPTHFLCYPEMCFIKAEALFRKGDKSGAFTAYKDGVKAHIDLLNVHLSKWNDPSNIAKTPISDADRDSYLNTALGTANDLTLGKIMTQKFIALSFSHQSWNDMRRLDYGLASGVAPGAYPGWAEPYERTSGYNDSYKMYIPENKQYRRLAWVSHEFNYNNAKLAASHPHQLQTNIVSYPVWFDYPNDNYLNAE
ncbi:MAG: SusD/RagB family nutrient-binding outer membrane lipoprotein [Dysgonamonadaceae bacterium]|jgi:hypothetical protein|nr:SusD/RagB family nutrient-binding outer membrane lipoprotein [Dysgonamonadaceae bacterium]